MDNLSKKALILKKIFGQLEPGSFVDIIDTPQDAFKVQLRDGQMLLARLSANQDLLLDVIDDVC